MYIYNIVVFLKIQVKKKKINYITFNIISIMVYWIFFKSCLELFMKKISILFGHNLELIIVLSKPFLPICATICSLTPLSIGKEN